MPSDEDICAQARHILSEANLDEMTAKQLRNKLSEHFGVDLKPKKKIISAEIDRFVAEQAGNDDDQDEAAEPPAKKRRGWGGGKDTRFGSLLSPEMQEFLGVERMDKRTVTKKIWEYIKEKDLQYPKDRRKVVLDDKLKTIFKGTPAGMISMLKMPAQISRHVKIEDFVAD
ncbi:unnamed protein product [Pedinophyceae sp. YPF-701]|nr:unnamed protein product [Pedinophyceae sp. YPF-701]